MDARTIETLDLACAQVGKTIAKRPSKKLENLIRSALAVLEEQGIYALFLFLKTRGDSGCENVVQKRHEFLKATPQQAPLLSDNADVLTSLQQMAKNLDNLLLALDLVRQSLVYALYHAQIPQKSEV